MVSTYSTSSLASVHDFEDLRRVNSLDQTRAAKQASEPTLGSFLQRAAFAQLPARFYGLLQVSLPFAFQFWTWGWRRTAGWLVVASAFGLWALAQQQLEGYADADGLPLPASWFPLRLWRLARGAAAVLGSLITLGLLLEGFAQLMT